MAVMQRNGLHPFNNMILQIVKGKDYFRFIPTIFYA